MMNRRNTPTPTFTSETSIVEKRNGIRTRSQAGFTLVELLAALAILLLVTAVAATAIPTALRVYTETVDASNAQTLLSTATERLRDELSVADPTQIDESSIKISDDLTVTQKAAFESRETGLVTILAQDADGLCVLEPTSMTDEGVYTFDSSGMRRLIPKAAGGSASSNFIVTIGDVEYKSNGYYTVNEIRVVQAEQPEQVVGSAELDTFDVKVFSA